MPIAQQEISVFVLTGLVLISVGTLILPFLVKKINENIELFFLLMGILAVSVVGNWSWGLFREAVESPVMISGIPVGIFQVVLILGFIIHFLNRQFKRAFLNLINKLDARLFIFLLILFLGLFSSVLSVIITAVILAEILTIIPLERQDKIKPRSFLALRLVWARD